ncbi:MAG TPA: CbiX/SirB N-terminal domain-containing protein [Rhodoferax sp.]|nr:CbiX/SirB N-terminal domain-containing protein [Rhodoferax sp.]
MQATVLFGHGSSDPAWRIPIDQVAQTMLLADPQALVCCAFLERTKPDLASTVADLAQKGVTHVTIVPMFLGIGRHAREDMPMLVKSLQAVYPKLNFRLKPSVGEEPEVIALLARIARPTTNPFAA